MTLKEVKELTAELEKKIAKGLQGNTNCEQLDWDVHISRKPDDPEWVVRNLVPPLRFCCLTNALSGCLCPSTAF